GSCALAACAAGDANTGPEVVRDTLPNGAVLLRYAALPDPAGEPAGIELSIGEVEGEGPEIFGDVRGIEADADGNIYIFDYQATEVRVFDPQGEYLRTIGRKGGGPGEITEANGMVFDRDGTLWLHDHGKWQMVGFDVDGQEVGRYAMHVRSYAYVFRGVLDDRGDFWKTTSEPVGDQPMPPSDGLTEGTYRMYAKRLDPATGAVDSVYVAQLHSRGLVARMANGYRMGSIPFSGGTTLAIDPAGGFRLTSKDASQAVRL